jgi:predicted PurR-regulated permease PerM
MANALKNLKKIGGTLLTAIALDGYRRSVVNDSRVREADKLYEKTLEAHKEATKTLESMQDQIVSNSQQVETRVNSVIEQLNSLQQDATNLINAVGNTNSNDALIETAVQSVKKTNSKADLNALLNDLDKNKYISDFTDNISNFLDNFNNYLSSLSTIELGAVAHTLAAVTILLCLLSILSAYYGDRLIIYFNLETRFPKLAKIIRLRRTFQDYYIGFNAI